MSPPGLRKWLRVIEPELSPHRHAGQPRRRLPCCLPKTKGPTTCVSRGPSRDLDGDGRSTGCAAHQVVNSPRAVVPSESRANLASPPSALNPRGIYATVM